MVTTKTPLSPRTNGSPHWMQRLPSGVGERGFVLIGGHHHGLPNQLLIRVGRRTVTRPCHFAGIAVPPPGVRSRPRPTGEFVTFASATQERPAATERPSGRRACAWPWACTA